MGTNLDFSWELVERNIETGKERVFSPGSSKTTAEAALNLRSALNEIRGNDKKYELYIRQRKNCAE